MDDKGRGRLESPGAHGRREPARPPRRMRNGRRAERGTCTKIVECIPKHYEIEEVEDFGRLYGWCPPR